MLIGSGVANEACAYGKRPFMLVSLVGGVTKFATRITSEYCVWECCVFWILQWWYTNTPGKRPTLTSESCDGRSVLDSALMMWAGVGTVSPLVQRALQSSNQGQGHGPYRGLVVPFLLALQRSGSSLFARHSLFAPFQYRKQSSNLQTLYD